MKRWIPAITLLVALLLMVVWRIKQKRADASMLVATRLARMTAPVVVSAAPAKVRDLVRDFDAVGQADALLAVRISPQITGQIQFLQVRQGDAVRQGQLLASLDPSEVQANVRQQQANVAEAQYRLAQAELTENPTVVGVDTNIRQQQSSLNSAQANYNEQLQDQASQIATANSAVVDARGKVGSMLAALRSAQANYRQTYQNFAAMGAAARAAVVDAQGRINNAKAAQGVAEAQIKSAQANVANAQTKLTRANKLFAGNAVPTSSVEDAQTTLDVEASNVNVAQQQLEATKAQLASQEAERDSAQQELDITLTKGKADIQAAAAAVNQAQANLDSARAELKSTQDQYGITVNKTEAAVEAQKQMVASSRAAVQNAVANRAQKPAYLQNLAALRATVSAAQALLRTAQAQLSYTTLKSPIDGVVTARYQDPGSLGTPSNPILAIDMIKQVYITVTVPEEVERKVVLGMPVAVRFDALPNRSFVSKVSQINPSADPQSRQFTVQTILDNPTGQVKPGMFARAEFEVARTNNAIVVPREAVSQDGPNATVDVVGGDKKVEVRPVTLGPSDADGIAITSGLRPGEMVVTTESLNLKTGKAVRIESSDGSGGSTDGKKHAAGHAVGG